jgi:signal transduction histidine kinase
VQTGRPAVSRDLLNDPAIAFSAETREGLRDTPVRAALAVPLIVRGRTIGALALGDDVGRVFGAREIELAQAFASQAAIALELARIYDETEDARQEAEELARVAKSLTETLDEAAIGEQVVAAATSIFRAQNCTLRLLEEGDVMRLLAIGGPASQTMILPRDMPAGMGVPGVVLQSGEAVWTPDLLTDPRVVATSEMREGFSQSDTRAVLAVPLRVRGILKGVLAIADQTGRRFAERHIRLLQMLADQVAVALENAQNYKAVQQAYDELSHTHAQLTQAQKMESIGRLAGGIAHDFNNLLTVITGRAALELGRIGADAPTRKSLSLIEATANRAGALTRQLLAFSRKQLLTPQVLDLNVALRGIEPILRRLIGEDIGVTLTLDAQLGRAQADPGQVEQVVLNLAVNARDAMPEGGVLTIETANAVLSPAYVRQHIEVQPGPYVMLAVRDTGVGMSTETMGRIFEPFFTTKEAGKGTGLGLATVYGIVKQSGGHVTVESQIGQGTTFKVFLPRIADPATADAAGFSSPGSSCWRNRSRRASSPSGFASSWTVSGDRFGPDLNPRANLRSQSLAGSGLGAIPAYCVSYSSR